MLCWMLCRRSSCARLEGPWRTCREEHKKELNSEGFRERCATACRRYDRSGRGLLAGKELTEAVQSALPQGLIDRRLHDDDVAALALAFDTSPDGKISWQEFTRFCQWTVAMDLLGFFSGTAPAAQVAEVGRWTRPARCLLLVSERLDPEKQLRTLAHPDVRCVYYCPSGLTLNEFSAQLESAALIRRKRGFTFESVALANHGPDEDGLWHICKDWPVPLRSTDQAWEMLMPLFHALADMVTGATAGGPVGHVDLLACSFAATSGGLDCLAMIEQKVKARFSASTDETGNAEDGGDWVLERGSRNVASIYFNEGRLGEFHKLMKPASKHRNRAGAGRLVAERSRDGKAMTRTCTSKVVAKQLKKQVADDAKNGMVDLPGTGHAVAEFVDHSGAAVQSEVMEHYMAVEGLIAELAELGRKREQPHAPKLTKPSDPRMKGHRTSPVRFRGLGGRDPRTRHSGGATSVLANPQEFDTPNPTLGMQAKHLRENFGK